MHEETVVTASPSICAPHDSITGGNSGLPDDARIHELEGMEVVNGGKEGLRLGQVDIDATMGSGLAPELSPSV